MREEQNWKSQERPLIQLEADIWQLRLPLPYALDHVNVYLIYGDEGWTLVDTGLNIAKARALWESAFAELGIGSTDIAKIVVTHVHPDHFGLAGWLQNRFSKPGNQVPVFVSETDYKKFVSTWSGISDNQPFHEMERFLMLCGLPEDAAQVVAQTTKTTGAKTTPHPTFTSLRPDSPFRIGNRNWDAIRAPGHADGQVIFYDPADRLFLSGDQLLMKITPNIGYWNDTEPGVLQRYLDSLSQLERFDVRVGLPGHKWLIHNWQQRIRELLAHHEERLATTLDAVRQTTGVTVDDVSQSVFRLGELNSHQSSFAIAETLAHLDWLEASGEVQRETVDGVWRFSIA